MKAEERKELEQNTLVKDTRLLVEGVRSGKFLNYRIIGLILAVVVVGGVWWYAIRESRSSTSAQWAGLSTAAGSQLEEYSQAHQKDLAGKIARLNLARLWYGPEGVAQLNASDPEKRTKGVENVQKARDEFVKLTDDLKDDKTLRAAAFTEAAEAELTLVGIPKATGSNEERGTVAKAVEYYRQAAATAGEGTEYGGKLKEKADKLEKDAAEIQKVARTLYNPLSPTTGDPHGFGTPKAPSALTPIPDPKPPTGETPKAPESLTPPSATTPEPKKDAAPPTAEPKKEATPPAPAPTPKDATPPAPTPAPTTVPSKK